jgi:hypothetical protein
LWGWCSVQLLGLGVLGLGALGYAALAVLLEGVEVEVLPLPLIQAKGVVHEHVLSHPDVLQVAAIRRRNLLACCL